LVAELRGRGLDVPGGGEVGDGDVWG
jgi:hypothetical protein